MLEHDTTAKESDIAGLRKQVAQLEDVMINCVARINVGLREATDGRSAQNGGGNPTRSDDPEHEDQSERPLPLRQRDEV